MTQTLQAHPLREKRCLQFKKLRWISISHPRVSSASSAKTAGAPPGLPSLPPRAVTTLPCDLCVHWSSPHLWGQDETSTSLHRWYFRERKGWGSKSSSAGTMEGGCFSWPQTSCVALCSVQKFETAESWEGCGPFHSPTLLGFLFSRSSRVELGWAWLYCFCSKYRDINLGSISRVLRLGGSSSFSIWLNYCQPSCRKNGFWECFCSTVLIHVASL